MDPIEAMVDSRLPIVDINAQCLFLGGNCGGDVVVGDSLLMHRTLLICGVMRASCINVNIHSLSTR